MRQAIKAYLADPYTRWLWAVMGVLLGGFLAVALGGCGTIRGLAQDIDSASAGVARAASGD